MPPPIVCNLADTSRINSLARLYTFKVAAGQWHTGLPGSKEVCVKVDALTSDVLTAGKVVMFVYHEQDYVPLPFTYHIIGRGASLLASYEPGMARIDLLGNLVPDTHGLHVFKLLVIAPGGFAQPGITPDYSSYTALRHSYRFSK